MIKIFLAKKVGLSVSTQFEAETFAQAFRKVCTFGPTFRADKSHTHYHAAEPNDMLHKIKTIKRQEGISAEYNELMKPLSNGVKPE